MCAPALKQRVRYAAFVLILAAACVGSGLAWGQDEFVETPVAKCVLGRLRAWETLKKRGDVVEVKLPAKIEPISLSSAECLRDFNAGVGLFRSEWGEPATAFLRDVAERGSTGQIEKGDRVALNARLKEIRSVLKTLRFLYIADSFDHKCPPALNELTIAVGKVRDAVQGKRATMADLKDAANRLAKAVKSKNLALVEKELGDFRASDRDGFDRWLRKNLLETRAILSNKRGQAKDFHQARKNLQAILAVYQVELGYQPKRDDWRTVARYLLQEAEDVGDANAAWERADSAGDINYNKSEVKYPKDVRKRLLDFIDRIMPK